MSWSSVSNAVLMTVEFILERCSINSKKCTEYQVNDVIDQLQNSWTSFKWVWFISEGCLVLEQEIENLERSKVRGTSVRYQCPRDDIAMTYVVVKSQQCYSVFRYCVSTLPERDIDMFGRYQFYVATLLTCSLVVASLLVQTYLADDKIERAFVLRSIRLQQLEDRHLVKRLIGIEDVSPRKSQKSQTLYVPVFANGTRI